MLKDDLNDLTVTAHKSTTLYDYLITTKNLENHRRNHSTCNIMLNKWTNYIDDTFDLNPTKKYEWTNWQLWNQDWNICR